MRLLLVEDDMQLGPALADALSAEGWAVDISFDGNEGLHRLTTNPYDAAVLDVNLPGLDGFTVLALARERGTRVPVIVLTARASVGDRVRGLDAGADDYLVKPFSMDELCARLRALLRRGAPARPAQLSVGDLVFDPATRAATRAGRRLEDLTPKETELLEYFVRNAGVVVTRTMISEHIWNESFESFANVIDVHVTRLRRKLERFNKARLLHTVRGSGYILSVEAP